MSQKVRLCVEKQDHKATGSESWTKHTEKGHSRANVRTITF